MLNNVKLNYYQYKHLIDVYNTGGIPTEILNEPVESVYYRNLITADNILYFSRDAKYNFKLPIGVSLKDFYISEKDLMIQPYTCVCDDKEELSNFAKLTICYLLQTYKPDEYEVYYDLDLDDLKYLDNFHHIENIDSLHDVYDEVVRTRHTKYSKSGVYSYKKSRDDYEDNEDKFIIFLIADNESIRLVRTFNGNCTRSGVSFMSFENAPGFDANTLSFERLIRPIITNAEFKDEVNLYKEMLLKYNEMKGRM